MDFSREKNAGNEKTWKQMKKWKTENTFKHERNEGTWNKQIKKQKKTQWTRKHVEMWVKIDDFWEAYSKTWIA